MQPLCLQRNGAERDVLELCRARKAHKPEPESVSQATPADWPGKHLRVVVVPPFEDAEVGTAPMSNLYMRQCGMPSAHD